MHTSNLPSGRVAHHNSDFSGAVKFTLPKEAVEETISGRVFVDIPFIDLVALVAEHVRNQQISRIESVPNNILLGIER